MAFQYINKQESLLAKVKGRTGKISDRTHEEHLKLYASYVSKANSLLREIEEMAKGLDPDHSAQINSVSSAWRSLKIDLSFAMGGVVNHEIYFSILGGKGGPATGKIAELIHANFGSYEAFVRDLKATALAARGWVWTGYNPSSGLLFNYIGDSQNTYPIWCVKPILALDTYEHAYFADFLSARALYIDEFLNFLDWDAVNANLDSSNC
jgi:Fe-Mn family superoxide dismutase